jgi:tetratricopeptide (TPR) repeat protein
MEAGLCELAIGNNSEAEKLFKRAYSLKETAHAALLRGVALKRLNNFLEAIEALSSALSIDPSIASIYIELGQCLEAVSNCEAATRLYLDLPTNAPSETKTFALNRLGQCYSKLGNRQALTALLDSEAYTEYMNTPYAIASNVLWSLQLNRRIDDEHLIRQAQTLTDHYPKQPMFDALTLHIAKRVRIDTDVLERYRPIFF